MGENSLRKVGDKKLSSEYLRQAGFLNNRKMQISVIQDMINGLEAIHAKKRWKLSTSCLDDTDWYKMYVSFMYLPKVINELKILAPYMGEFNTKDIKKIKLLTECLNTIKWNSLFYEIYETLETKGDFFAYWNTQDESKKYGIPILKVLNSERIEDIIKDPYTHEVTAITYKETIVEEEVDESTGEVYDKSDREVTWIFKKGKIRIIDRVRYADSGGYKDFFNKPEYGDQLRIMHIPSFIDQKDKFSKIPAVDYIDPCLLLAKIDTNRSVINDHLGFKHPVIVGGQIDQSRSALVPGGSTVVMADGWAMDMAKMPEVHFMEINNDLKSIVDEKYDAVSDLYKKACLIREGLEEKLSSSGSSRTVSQLRLGIEQKNKKYYNNIAKAFEQYFYVVLNENGLWNKKDAKPVTFEIPKVLVNNSMFDELLLTTQLRALGLSTLTEELISKGFSKKEIEERMELINEELYGANADMSYSPSKEVKDRVASGANDNKIKGLDNNFRTESSIKVD